MSNELFSTIEMFKYKKNIISNSKITEKVNFLGLIMIDYVQKSEIIHKIILKKVV